MELLIRNILATAMLFGEKKTGESYFKKDFLNINYAIIIILDGNKIKYSKM